MSAPGRRVKDAGLLPKSKIRTVFPVFPICRCIPAETLEPSDRRSWLLTFLKKHPTLLLRSVRAVLRTVFSSDKFRTSIPPSMTSSYNDLLSLSDATHVRARPVASGSAHDPLFTPRIARSGSALTNSAAGHPSLTQSEATGYLENTGRRLTSAVDGFPILRQPDSAGADRLVAACSGGRVNSGVASSLGARTAEKLSGRFSPSRADGWSASHSTSWEFSDPAGTTQRLPQTFRDLLVQHQHPLVGLSAAPRTKPVTSRSSSEQATLLEALHRRRYSTNLLLQLRPQGKPQLTRPDGEVSGALRFYCRTIQPATRAPLRQVPWNSQDKKRRQHAVLSPTPSVTVGQPTGTSAQEPLLPASHAEPECFAPPHPFREGHPSLGETFCRDLPVTALRPVPDTGTKRDFPVDASNSGCSKNGIHQDVSLEEKQSGNSSCLPHGRLEKYPKDDLVALEPSPWLSRAPSDQAHALCGAQAASIRSTVPPLMELPKADASRQPAAPLRHAPRPGLLRAPHSDPFSSGAGRPVGNTVTSLPQETPGPAASSECGRKQDCPRHAVGLCLPDREKEVSGTMAVKSGVGGEHREFPRVKHPSAGQTAPACTGHNERKSGRKPGSPESMAKGSEIVPSVALQNTVAGHPKAYGGLPAWITSAPPRNKLSLDPGTDLSPTLTAQIGEKTSNTFAAGCAVSTGAASYGAAVSMPPRTSEKLDQRARNCVGAALNEVGAHSPAAAKFQKTPQRLTSIIPGPFCAAKERAVREVVLQGARAFVGAEVPWFVRWYGELTEAQFSQWLDEETQKLTGNRCPGDGAGVTPRSVSCPEKPSSDSCPRPRRPHPGFPETLEKSRLASGSLLNGQTSQVDLYGADARSRPRTTGRRNRRRNNGKKKANEPKNASQELPLADSGGANRQKPLIQSRSNNRRAKAPGKAVDTSTPSREAKSLVSPAQTLDPDHTTERPDQPSSSGRQKTKSGLTVSSSPKKRGKEQRSPLQPDPAVAEVQA